MQHGKSLWSRFLSNERGNVAIIFALAAVPVAVLAGGTVDYGNALSRKAKLQAAADAASVAATIPVNASILERVSIATKIFNANIVATDIAGTVPNIVATGTTVTVTAATQSAAPFLSLINIPTLAIGVESTAAGRDTASNTNPGKVCLLSLDPNSDDGIHLQGANQVNYADCWAHTNSTKGTAINAVGNVAKAVGKGHCAVGNYTQTHDTFTPLPTAGCAPVEDPFATIGAYSNNTYRPTFTPPTQAVTCKATNLSLKKGAFTLDPGRYCGGIDIKAGAAVTLNAGIYYVDNGVLNVQSGATLTGSNVMFYLAGLNSTMTIIGGGTVDLSGRTSGSSYQGFLVIQHPDAARFGTSNIQGGGTFKLQGTIYMPTQRIEVAGNGDVNAAGISYFGMVAKDFYFRGNGVFNAKKFSGGDVPDIMPTMPVDQLRTTSIQ